MVDTNEEISEEEEKSPVENYLIKKSNNTPSQRFKTKKMRVSFMDKISELEETPDKRSEA